MAAFLVFFTLCAIISGAAAADSDALQDICVADHLSSGIKLNGYPCKVDATAMDFFFAGFAKPALTNTTMGAVVTGANVQKIPGLNTQGVSMSRIDYAPGGLNPPHTHPRATEIVFVLYGELEVGFITTAKVLFSKTIKQVPGTQSIAATLFASTPTVPNNELTKAFQIDDVAVYHIKAMLGPKK
ncbi:hypothetical protein ACHQM5_004429 [Ranunculus cassubicifolius]